MWFLTQYYFLLSFFLFAQLVCLVSFCLSPDFLVGSLCRNENNGEKNRKHSHWIMFTYIQNFRRNYDEKNTPKRCFPSMILHRSIAIRLLRCDQRLMHVICTCACVCVFISRFQTDGFEFLLSSLSSIAENQWVYFVALCVCMCLCSNQRYWNHIHFNLSLKKGKKKKKKKVKWRKIKTNIKLKKKCE